MISIIILTYNSELYIKKLLDSILERYKDSVKRKEIEIIVADNDSKDDTVSVAMQFRDLVSIVNNGGNLGFAKGNNEAVKKAKGTHILFLNPDSEFFKGDIRKMLSILDISGNGIVGGRILTYKEHTELSCGKFYNFLNILLLCFGLEEKFGVRFSPENSKYVDYVSGGFMGVKKDVFVQNGGFDEHYFMYVEDQDLCYRLKKNGLKTFFSTEAQIKHIGQGSSNRAFAVVNIYKGLSYFQKKHMSQLSYNLSVSVLKTKAFLLIIWGRITHNSYLTDTYEKAFQSI